MTIVPNRYAIISETSAVRLRPQTVGIARNTYTCVQIISSVLDPCMLNPIEWNWKGKTGFLWADMACAAAAWSYFRLPETKDRTYEELDVLFEKGIGARSFASEEFDVYAGGCGLAKG